MNRYKLVADEMGTPGMAPGVSNTFAFGGYVVAEDELPQAIVAWQCVKTEMCGNATVELKWIHFFVDAEDARITFLDSKTNEAIQIAEFICGVIWQAAQGDEADLAQFIDKCGPNATKQGLGILHIA